MEQRIQSAVTDLLDAHQCAFEVITIPLTEDKKPVRHLEALLQEKGLDPGCVVRSVVFRGGSGQFFMLALAGGGRADWGVLRQHLGERKLRMAELDEVVEATGYVVGAVPPIALSQAVKVLMDDSVHRFESLVIGSGVLGYALALKGADLCQLLAQAEQGRFARAED